MEPAGGGSGGRAMHFRRERLHTDRYIQRLDVTAHTHTHREKYIYKCMYIGEMPHWGRNVAALYIHTHTYIYIFSSLGRCFQRRLMGWAASGVGAGGQGAAARVVCVPLSHLKH